jgi:hypothetical protein
MVAAASTSIYSVLMRDRDALIGLGFVALLFFPPHNLNLPYQF